MIKIRYPYAGHLLVALKKTIPAVLLLGSLSLVSIPSARAQITVQFTQVGANVEVTWELAANTNFGSPVGYFDILGAEWSLLGGGLWSVTQLGEKTPFVFESGAGQNFAWGSSASAGIRTGAEFAFQPGADVDAVVLPAGYSLTNGDGLSGSLTFMNTVFTELGFASNVAASGMFDVAETTVTWSTVTASAVPEPGSYASIVALSALGLIFFRRRPNQRKNLGQ